MGYALESTGLPMPRISYWPKIIELHNSHLQAGNKMLICRLFLLKRRNKKLRPQFALRISGLALLFQKQTTQAVDPWCELPSFNDVRAIIAARENEERTEKIKVRNPFNRHLSSKRCDKE